MARKKTTKAALKAIDVFEKALKHFEEVIHIKTTYKPENVAVCYRKKTIDWYEGWISGVLSVCQQTLHDENCYFGYQHIDSKGQWLNFEDGQYITDHPEYRSYRISFYTRG